MAKVLIIEDSASQAAVISEIVEKAGHASVIYQDLTKGIAQTFKSIGPDIVLLDLVLLGPNGKPIADGFQICREVKRVSKGKAKVVIISAKGDDESAEWAVLQGADAFLQKPFAVDDLLSVMEEVLGIPPPPEPKGGGGGH
jgi:twitching motility two-component system response regulator PilH